MRNRFLALVICCLLLVTMLSGCTLAEKDFMALNKEMSSLKVMESSGKITVNFNKLPQELTDGKESLQIDLLKAMLSNLQINFRSKVDQPNQVSESSFYLVDFTTGQEKEIFSMSIKNNVIYIKVRELVDLAKMMQDPKLDKALEVGLGDADYISMTMQEYLEVATGGKLPPSTMLPLTSGNIFDNSLKQQTLMFGFLDGLMAKVYDNYELGMIKQDGSKYTLTLDTASVIPVIKPFLKYTVSNTDKLGSYLQEYLAKLSPEDLATLGLPIADVNQLKVQLDEFVKQAPLLKESMLAEIEELDIESLPSSLDPIEGSKMVLSLEKKDGAYLQNTLFNFVLNSPPVSLDMVIKSEQVTKSASSIEVNLPSQGIVSLSELMRRVTQEMQVKIDDKSYVKSGYMGKSTGKMSNIIKDGYTYLPLRKLAEELDETVGWDSVNSKAYVVKGSSKIYIQGLNIKGTVYIKVRDFEKLGYKVVWDASTRTALVSKTML